MTSSPEDRTRVRRGWIGGAALAALLALVGGCVMRAGPRSPASLRVPPRTGRLLGATGAGVGFLARRIGVTYEPAAERVIDSSPARIQCERVFRLPKVTLLNVTGQPIEVSLDGLAYAGGGAWERWWIQEGIRLPPRGAWSALLYQIRGERVRVRDRRGRLLADFDLLKGLPPAPFRPTVALTTRPGWQPPVPLQALGYDVSERYRWQRTIPWRTISPSQLPPREADCLYRYSSPVRIIGDARAEALTQEQLAGLRGMVARGGTLTVCGGADRARLAGWQRAGLLAVPIRGILVVRGLNALAQRYGLPPLRSPMPVAGVGPVAPPARVVLEESGVPLVIERPLGLGTLRLLTFDPEQTPFRHSALEKAFWQEWAERSAEGAPAFYLEIDSAPGFRQLVRKLHFPSPSVWILASLWLLYVLAVACALLIARRRLRWLVAVSLGGSLAALAVGPLLRSAEPVAAFAGMLCLRSGSRMGRWRGQAEVMVPRGGAVTLRVVKGTADVWSTPLLRMITSPYITTRSALERWQPISAAVDAAVPLPGAVTLEVELSRGGVFAQVGNESPYLLKDAMVLWRQTSRVRLGDLPPHGRVRRLLAQVERGGTLIGIREQAAEGYGPMTGFGNSPDEHRAPLLLAHCPELPLPTLLADEHHVRSAGYGALLVLPSRFRPRGAFRLPMGASIARVVKKWGESSLLTRTALRTGGLAVAPDGGGLIELQLPRGSGQARWSWLDLHVQGGAGTSFRVRLFDWTRQQWIALGVIADRNALPLVSPARFLNPSTDALLAQVENACGYPVAVKVEVSGQGEAREPAADRPTRSGGSERQP